MRVSQHSNMPNRNLQTICIGILSYFIVLVLFLHRTEGYSLPQHLEIENIERNCPELDSCKYRNETNILSALSERSCGCDKACNKFGDCCIDAPKSNSVKSVMKCYDVNEFGGVYMISKCPVTYEGEESLRELCENMDIADPSDPIGSVPVTNLNTGLTYKNSFCKLCNGDFDLVKFWKANLVCPGLSFFNESYTVTEEYILRNLIMVNETWGLHLPTTEGMFFYDCNIETEVPSYFQNKIRRCKPNLISDCPSSWGNEVVRQKCRSFQSPRYSYDGNGYRNVYCAICNNANTADLSCLSPQSASVKLFRFSAAHSFALILDFSIKRGEKVGKIKLCKSGEVYDPFFKKCRELQCIPGYVRRGRRCFPRRSVNKYNRKTPKYKRSYAPTRTPTTSISNVISTTATLDSATAETNKSYTKEQSTVPYETSSYKRDAETNNSYTKEQSTVSYETSSYKRDAETNNSYTKEQSTVSYETSSYTASYVYPKASNSYEYISSESAAPQENYNGYL